MLALEDRENVELKKLWMKRRLHNPLSGIKTWKKIKVETVRVNILFKPIPTDNITEINGVIYARAKLW